jgi:hypothetical protein
MARFRAQAEDGLAAERVRRQAGRGGRAGLREAVPEHGGQRRDAGQQRGQRLKQLRGRAAADVTVR